MSYPKPSPLSQASSSPEASYCYGAAVPSLSRRESSTNLLALVGPESSISRDLSEIKQLELQKRVLRRMLATCVSMKFW